jgi:NADPH:quinone reductase-like Zn-dependent oxidoreductase
MKAIVLRELGDPEKLRLEDVPDPTPGEGDVIVRLRAAALNRRDVWIRTGRYAGIKLPIILGSDGAGEVASVGAKVDRSLIGRPVMIYPGFNWGNDPRFQSAEFRILGLPDNGTYAQFVRVPAANVLPKPELISFEQSAALPVAGLTAYRAVVTKGRIKSGEVALVTGIGGGVATFLLQLLVARGARVYVTSGNDAKILRAKELGAAGGFNYRSQDWIRELKEQIGGVDIVIDGAGGETFDRALDVLQPGGRVVLYGATLGPVKELVVRRIFWKQLHVMGTTMGTMEEFRAMVQVYSTGGLRPVIDEVFAMEDVSAAHERMEAADQFGKIILNIG